MFLWTESLVFRKNTGDLVGYVDYGDASVTNLSKNGGSIASHVLAFYLRGACLWLHLSLKLSIMYEEKVQDNSRFQNSTSLYVLPKIYF